MLVRATLPSTIKLEVTLPAATGFVLVDATEIHQIVMNLCTNAMHAMQEKGGILGVRLEAVHVDDNLVAKQPSLHTGPYICLTISDGGHGMSQATIAHIFDPFYTTKGRGQGTGLGLAVVYGLVTKVGGAITVESMLEQGTTFKIYIPRVESDGLAMEGCEVAPPHGTEHILVVDDEESIVQVVTAALDHKHQTDP
jgi:signal transduction histidine kinase